MIQKALLAPSIFRAPSVDDLYAEIHRIFVHFGREKAPNDCFCHTDSWTRKLLQSEKFVLLFILVVFFFQFFTLFFVLFYFSSFSALSFKFSF